jgi:RimJ/RimL family protein N-acetyltransferase
MEINELIGEKIFTRRLQMRRIKASDLPLILAWSNSETAYGPYLTPERLTVQRLNEHYAGNVFWNPHDKTFLIETRDPVLPIGTIHYWLRQDQHQSAIMSVKIANVNSRGNGYGTEAQKFLIIHLFENVGVQTVEMYTDIDNGPQQRCLKKLGFSINRSLTYDDRQVSRTGHLFQLKEKDYQGAAIYRFHYE